MDPQPPPTYSETFGVKVPESVPSLPQEAPPNYNDLFPGVRSVKETVSRAREDGEGVKLPFKLCDLICKSFLCGCCYISFAALPIAMIVIGSVYLNDCQIQDRIPIFLIVFGCVSLLQTILGLCKMFLCRNDETDNEDRRKKGGNFCESLLVTFLFIWIIVGSAYTFGAWPYWVNNGRMSCPNAFCCEPVVMYFTFSVLIIMYGIAALSCFCIFCCICLAAMAASAN